MTDKKEVLAGFQFEISLYFSDKLFDYLSNKSSLGEFKASNGITIHYAFANTPGFENHTADHLFIDNSFKGKRSLLSNFANLDKFLAKKDRVIKAIKELRKNYEGQSEMAEIDLKGFQSI